MMSEPTILLTGRLENWVADDYGRDILWGFIYKDEDKRFRDGEWIRTSSIPDFNELTFNEGDIVHTLNSHYLLGKSLADAAFEESELDGS